MRFRKLAIFAIALLIWQRPASAQNAAAKAVPGKVILSLGMEPNVYYKSLTLKYETIDGKHSDIIDYNADTLLFSTKRDYDETAENGAVKILTLAPGDWKIYGIVAAENLRVFNSKKDFSVPFTVTSGKAIYLGSFRALMTIETSWLGSAPGGPIFELTNKSERDIALAKQKDKTIDDVSIEIPDIDALNDPLFVSKEPARPILEPDNIR